METWKQISERHEVSSQGRVRSIKSQRILNSHFSLGYEYVTLRIGNGLKRNYRVHRLVAQAFLPAEEGRNNVNHIDGNSSNNCVDNLEWCTQKENIYHSRNVTKNGSTISHKKIRELYMENGHLSTGEFVKLLLDNCR